MSIDPLYNDFPLLRERSVVYLDTAATAQKPARVLEAMDHLARTAYGPVPGGLYSLAAESEGQLFEARSRIASLVGADPHRTVFSSNATESINLACWGWARHWLRPGDAIAISPAEHHSNLVPWQQLAKRHSLSLRWLRLDDQGRLDMDYLEQTLRDPMVKLLTLAHAGNVLGTINPVSQISELTRAHDVRFFVDGTQAAPHMPVDFASMGADLYAWSGHKAYGPTGIGVLHTSFPLTQIEPTMTGGHMISSVTLQDSTWAQGPARLEPGTPRLLEAVGLGEACQLLEELSLSKVHAHGMRLVDYARPLLESLGAEIYGPTDSSERVGLLAFNLPGIHPHDLAEIAARSSVCLKAGHHCAQPLHHDVLRVTASTRASFAVHSTSQDVDRLIDALREAQSIFD